jgi:hypothetical protein
MRHTEATNKAADALNSILDDGVVAVSWQEAVETVAKKIREAYEAGLNDGEETERRRPRER